MHFFPKKIETINVSLSRYEVLGMLQDSMQHEDIRHKFNGVIGEDSFQISLVLKRYNNFTPVISGMIEAEKKSNSIILLKYELIESSKKFLAFWSVLTILITLFFAIPYHAYLYASISFAACFVNYMITYENFKIQVRKSRRALLTVLGAN